MQQRKKIILEKAASIVKGINGSIVMQSGLLDEVRNKSLQFGALFLLLEMILKHLDND